MRIALVDRPSSSDRPGGVNRFTEIAPLLRRTGHEVVLLDGTPAKDAGTLPTLTGLNRAVAASPLIDAHALALYLADLKPDLVIAPLRGGISQGVLMARDCAEAFETTRVALWCDTPSRERYLREEDPSTGLGPIISDALERQTLRLADALIVPENASAQLLASLGRPPDALFRASLPVATPALPPAESKGIGEIVFGGSMQRHAGLIEFIEVLKRLSDDGLLADRIVVFPGPLRSDAQGIGTDWLGRVATRWNFAFKVVDRASPNLMQASSHHGDRLTVVIGDDPDAFLPVRRSGGRHIALLRSPEAAQSLSSRLEERLRAALESAPFSEAVSAPATVLDWPDLIGRLATGRSQQTAGTTHTEIDAGITVCVLHHRRLAELAVALASIPDVIGQKPVEIIVLENGSDIDLVEDKIRDLSGRRENLRIVGFPQPVHQALALNRGLAEARFQTVLFLDDDNYYAPGGVARLGQAISTGRLDIAVTALDVFDDSPKSPAPVVGRLVFLGAAHTAGLFFNSFGDTALAVHRDSFMRFGGFHDPGHDYPALDWVTLAKAQAAGLRIGALQWPAVRYRRDNARADMSANKLDQEGARSLVFDAYAGTYDADLVARYAQKLDLRDL